jgi:pimeloyl-ACP methyl ester carboxylesterase
MTRSSHSIPPRPRTALLLVLALATSLAPSAAAASANLEITRKELRTATGRRIETDAGRLRVPERRGAAGSRPIPIGFPRLRSSAPRPRAPLFFLNGGPGSRAVSENPRSLDFRAPFLDVSDVVLVDQRGTNDSNLASRWDGPPPPGCFLHADSALRFVPLEDADPQVTHTSVSR